MRDSERVKLNREVSKELIEKIYNIPSDRVADSYIVSYLPIISDSLASIADSLEILTKDIGEVEDGNDD